MKILNFIEIRKELKYNFCDNKLNVALNTVTKVVSSNKKKL